MNENTKQNLISRFYWKVFDWFAAPGQRLHAVRAYKLHTLLLLFTLSQVFMLLFTALSFHYLSHPLLNWAPYLALLVSWLALFSYRHFKNIFLTTNLYLISATSFIFLFCWLTDGFRQTSYAWFALVPVVAGMLTNRGWTFIWASIVIALDVFGYWAAATGRASDLLSQEGHFTLTILQQSCFIVFVTILTTYVLSQQKNISQFLRERTLSKQNLLRILVHDISTPLGLIQFNAQLVTTSGSNVNPQVACLNIQKNTERITNVIRVIRDLEKWEKENKHLPAEPVELSSLLNQVIELYQNRLYDKKIRLHKYFTDEVYVLGNETILSNQIIGNIISNAIKFSFEKSKIEISIEPVSDHTIKLKIRDYGIGISKKNLADLLDPLATTTRQGTNGETGTGFGLAIAKNCVQMQGGELHIDSQTKEENPSDYGTAITIVLKRHNATHSV